MVFLVEMLPYNMSSGLYIFVLLHICIMSKFHFCTLFVSVSFFFIYSVHVMSAYFHLFALHLTLLEHRRMMLLNIKVRIFILYSKPQNV